MSFAKILKTLLHTNSVGEALHTFLRGAEQKRRIQNEYRLYRTIAEKKGIDEKDLTLTTMCARFKDRLSSRNIVWPPPTVKPHIVYASTPSIWEPHNLPPQIAKVGDCSLYYLEQRPGYDKNWTQLEKRRFCDADILPFIEKLHREKPIQFMLTYLSGAWLSTATIERINALGIVTMMFHLDDRISFRGRMVGDQWSGAASVASTYDLCLTASDDSIVKYAVEGGRAILWPEGANPEVYRPLDLPFKYDLSFIGARYGRRSPLINYLRNNGISVECFGNGWENGKVSDAEMVEIYAQSRINLGFGYIGYSTEQHFKGRDFEVPMCGALYLTSYNRYLPMVYDVGNEIVTYTDKKDCLKVVKELLADPARCARIHTVARERALRDHTWERRIRTLLEIGNS